MIRGAYLVILAGLAAPVACKLPGRKQAVLRELRALERTLSGLSQLERLRSDTLYSGWLRKLKDENAKYDARFVTLSYELLDYATQGTGVSLKYWDATGQEGEPNGELLHLEQYVDDNNPRIVASSTPDERGGVNMCIAVPAGLYTSKSTQKGLVSANKMSSDKSTGLQTMINDVKDGLKEELTGEAAQISTQGNIPVSTLPRTFCFQPPKASTKWHEFNYYATKTGQPQSSGFVFNQAEDGAPASSYVTEETHKAYLARWKEEIVGAVRTFKKGVNYAEALVAHKKGER